MGLPVEDTGPAFPPGGGGAARPGGDVGDRGREGASAPEAGPEPRAATPPDGPGAARPGPPPSGPVGRAGVGRSGGRGARSGWSLAGRLVTSRGSRPDAGAPPWAPPARRSGAAAGWRWAGSAAAAGRSAGAAAAAGSDAAGSRGGAVSATSRLAAGRGATSGSGEVSSTGAAGAGSARGRGAGRFWRRWRSGGRGLFGRGLAGAALGRLGLGRGHLTTKALTVGLAPDAIGLGILDARRMALDADAERLAQVECLFVREPELSCQLVDPDLLGQLLSLPLCSLSSSMGRIGPRRSSAPTLAVPIPPPPSPRWSLLRVPILPHAHGANAIPYRHLASHRGR